MEYYVVIEGQKQGPYDLLSLIKKVKNGTLTPETLVSTNDKTAFRPARDFEELKPILKGSAPIAESSGNGKTHMTLKEMLTEGVDLWSRRVIEYTVASGLILAIGFGILSLMKKVQLLADFPSIINYVVSFVVVGLFSIFFYYVLITKRSQEPDLKEYVSVAKKNVVNVAVFAALFSLYAFSFEFGTFAGVLALALWTFVTSFIVFVPFLIMDNDLRLKDAVRVSIDRVKTAGAEAYGVILTLVAINLAVAIIPAAISPNLFVFGLFISIPITVSALSYVYDRIFG